MVESACRRLQALIDFAKPTAVVACFDRRSFRHDLLPEYKAGRKPKLTGLVDDLQDAEHKLGHLAQVAYEHGYEADDCLATLARIGVETGDRVVIASPDKDLRQCLLSGQVTILRKFATSGGSLSAAEYLTALKLQEDLGVRPEQWTDFQTLVGDKGDGIVGCPGWGETTTVTVLQKCGTLEACYANIWAVPCSGKQRDALLAFRKRVELVRKLVTLRTDVAAVADALR